MRKADLKPLELYASNPTAARSVYRQSVPALLLDTRWWDLQPSASGPVMTLSPEDATRSALLDSATGARRGLLVAQATPSLVYTDGFDESEVASQLAALAQEEPSREVARLDRQADPASALDALRGILPEGLILNVVLLGGLQHPWDSKIKLPCPSCGEHVHPDGAGRLRPHKNPGGQRCTPHLYRCPSCRKPVGLDSGNRVLYHERPGGKRCRMTNFPLPPEAREASLIEIDPSTRNE